MISLPWILLVAGVLLVIVGYLNAIANPARNRINLFHRRMSDEQIAEQLKSTRGSRIAIVLLYLGVLLIAVSIGWRFVLAFL